MPKRSQGAGVVIFLLVILLLVVMPALIYVMGWGVRRYTRKPPS